MTTLWISLILVACAVALLGVKVFFTSGGRFPNTHIHDNQEMRRRGISCPRDKEFYQS